MEIAARGAPPAPASMANALISIKMGVNKPPPVRAEAPTPGICNWAWKYVEVQRRSGKICNSVSKDVL